MSDHEIVTQHFDDPIGSFVHVNGKCYVKISNKTHTINTPIATDQNSVYYKTIDDCKNTRVIEGRMLCPPKNILIFEVAETSAYTVMSFDIPSQSIPPTSLTYVPKPIQINRTLARATLSTTIPYTLPTDPINADGSLRSKSAIARVIARANVYHGESPSISVINKMLHK